MAGTGILAMLAKPKGGAKAPPAEDPTEEKDEVASSLREMFDALKAGNDNEAASAFRAAYEHCAGGGEPDEDDKAGDDGLDM